jgi:hypothetical protein
MLDLLNPSLAKLCPVNFIAVAEALRMFHESIRAISWPLTKVSLMYPWLDNPGSSWKIFRTGRKSNRFRSAMVACR